jgi:hypothetical protein
VGGLRKPHLVPLAALVLAATLSLLISCSPGDTGLLTSMKAAVVGAVSGFTAVANSTTQVTLKWNTPVNPLSTMGIIITRKSGSAYPTSPTDGTQLSGMVLTNGSFIDTSSIAANTRYSYSAWMSDTKSGTLIRSSVAAQDWADTTIGSNLPITLPGGNTGYLSENLGFMNQGFPVAVNSFAATHLYAVMKFSPAVGLPVTGAQLILNASSSTPVGAHTLDVGQILKTWSPPLTAYNLSYTDLTTPTNVGVIATSPNFTSYNTTVPVVIDVTGIVQAWAAGATNNGLFIAEHSSNIIDTISATPTLTFSYWYEYPF